MRSAKHSGRLHLVYLGAGGVLHPSATLYKMVHGHSPWNDGHVEYEGVAILEAALAGWPDARIVLTTTNAWVNGVESVLQGLGPSLAQRVIGSTFEDLTTQVRFGPRQLVYAPNDYRRLSRSEVVRAHVRWCQPSAWIAIDDDNVGWTTDERRTNLVATDGCEGLLELRTQDRLMTVLIGNFGPPLLSP